MYYHTDSPANKANTQAASVIKKRFIKTGHTCLGVSDGTGLTLTGADRHDSLLWSRRGSEPAGTAHSWSPYGSGKPAAASLPGFNGERLDPVSGTCHLGKGYRAYNPVLMRFNCPDDLSPFGAGGINPYAYCAGDPVNHTDPSGHLSWQSILGITLGAIGLAAVIFTGGASIIAAGGVMAAVSSASATALTVGSLGVVADVTAIASGAVEGSDPEASSILGWVSFASGIVAAGVGISMAARTAIKIRNANKKAQIAKTHKILPEKTRGVAGSARNNSPTRYPSTSSQEIGFVQPFGSEFHYSAADESWFAFSRGYISDVHGTGEPGLVIHGSPSGKLSFYEGAAVPSPGNLREFNVQDLVKYVNDRFNINLFEHGGEKLHLVACYSGGEKGTAQQLATYLKRSVVGYGGHEEILYPSIYSIQGNPHAHVMRVNKRLSYEELIPKIYYPRRVSI